MLGKSLNNPLNSSMFFKNLNRQIATKDKGTSFDSTTINSIKSDPISYLKSDVQSAIKNPLQGSKTVLTLNKNNNMNNLNRDKRSVGKNSLPKSSLFESTCLPRILKKLEERSFGDPIKPLPGIKNQTDGITANNKNQFGLNGPKMSQGNEDLGLKVNRYDFNAQHNILTSNNTPRINRQINPLTNLGTDNTKLQPEIKPIG